MSRKGYRTRVAKSAYKRGPSGALYMFEVSQTVYPATLPDEQWMDELCEKRNKYLLVEVVANKSINKKKKLRKVKVADLIVGDPVVIDKGTPFAPDKEEKIIDIALAKEVEEAEKLRQLNVLKNIDGDKYLNDEILEEPIRKILRVIEIFLEESKLPLETKKEMVNYYINKDPQKRETLRGRVIDILNDFKEV